MRTARLIHKPFSQSCELVFVDDAEGSIGCAATEVEKKLRMTPATSVLRCPPQGPPSPVSCATVGGCRHRQPSVDISTGVRGSLPLVDASKSADRRRAAQTHSCATLESKRTRPARATMIAAWIGVAALALLQESSAQLTSRSSLSNPETWPDCECVTLDGRIQYCSNLAGLSSVKQQLIDRDCEKDCRPEACQRAFYTMMQHHDGCRAGTFDAMYGVFYHDIEWECQIRCYEDPAPRTELDTCEYECSSRSNVESALQTLESSNCPGNPIADDCRESFRVLEAYHHVCRGGDQGLMAAYHKFKGEYVPACNPPSRDSRSIDCDSTINREAIDELADNSAKQLDIINRCMFGLIASMLLPVLALSMPLL